MPNATRDRISELGERIQEFKDREQKRVDILQEQVERLEGQIRAPGFTMAAANDDPESLKRTPEYKAFNTFLRSGDRSILEPAEASTEQKAYLAGSGTGANAVPEEINREVLRQVLLMSPIRQNAMVVNAQSGDYKHLVAADDLGAQWSGESDTRSETATATLNSVAPTGGELNAVVKLSRWFLEDAVFDAAEFVLAEAARQFATAEESAFVTGDGTSKPTGLAASATSASADDASPARAFGTYQHIPSGIAGGLPSDYRASPPGDPLAPFIDTVSELRMGYLSNSAWYMNPTTRGTIVKLRDVDGRPLVETGIMGQPDRLQGYPIRLAEHLADIAANSLPIVFGDMRRGYLIVDRGPLVIVRDDLTDRGHVIFYVARRVYGKPLDTNALKFLKIATS